MNELQIFEVVLASTSGAVAGFFGSAAAIEKAALARRKRSVIERLGATGASGKRVDDAVIEYATRVSRSIEYRTTEPIAPTVRLGRAGASHTASFIEEHAGKSGVGDSVTPEGFIEARLRLSTVGLASGALFGSVFSNEMAMLLGAVCAYVGWSSIARAMLKREKERGVEAMSHVSEMLEVVALGLRSGLTFDRSFELYGEHFSSDFAKECSSCCKSWTLGITSRSRALRDFADSYECEELDHAIDGIVRSLRFGTSFAESLEELASQSRASYRAVVSEKVAKAPVKMMLPTGTLILPAMLLLVLGPVLLELASGF